MWFKIYFKSQDGNTFRSNVKEIQVESAPFGKLLELNLSFWFPPPSPRDRLNVLLRMAWVGVQSFNIIENCNGQVTGSASA